MFAVYFQVHAVELAFEDDGEQCHEVGEVFHAPEAFALVGNLHDACS